jgi:hypothetical protein
MNDSVGFGFVVRGKEPVYVQTVDPEGPAAGAGLRVRLQFYLLLHYFTHMVMRPRVATSCARDYGL